jgi:hypothetical protein
MSNARSVSSVARMMMCTTVGNYFWLLTRQSSGAGQGDRWRGCVLTSCAGGVECDCVAGRGDDENGKEEICV